MLWITLYITLLIVALYAWARHWNHIEPHHKPDEHETAFNRDHAHTPAKSAQATYRAVS